jgi:hypothetical protein
MFKTSKLMKQKIEALARREGIDLTRVGAYMRFEMAPYQPMYVETIAPGLVAVAHTFVQYGDVMKDPEIVFSTTTVADAWCPVECTQHAVGSRAECAEVNESGCITGYRRRAYGSVMELVGMWARNIGTQGWLKGATCTRKEAGI